MILKLTNRKKHKMDETIYNKCKHEWICLNNDRIHNKGDGKGKYQAFKCAICKKFQRRYFQKKSGKKS